MYCTQCGTITQPDAKFCSKCGSPISETKKTTVISDSPDIVLKPKAHWLYTIGILGVVVALIGVYAAVFIPAIAGSGINPQSGYGLLFWNGLFFYLIWKRRARKGWHGLLLGFLIGILVFFVASFIGGFSKSKNEGIKAVTSIQQDITNLKNSAIDSSGLPKRIENPVDTTPTAKGEAGEFEKCMKTILNRNISQRNDYISEIDAIGWDKILDPNRIKADKTLVDSKKIIQRAKNIVIKYKDQTSAIIDNARKEINNLNITESTKREALKAFDNGVVSSRARVTAIWDYEFQSILEVEKIIALLYDRQGKWSVQNNQIVFVDDTDVNEFNQHIASIEEITKKQEAVQVQSFESVNNKLNKLKE
jgi:hypothetical protein